MPAFLQKYTALSHVGIQELVSQRVIKFREPGSLSTRGEVLQLRAGGKCVQLPGSVHPDSNLSLSDMHERYSFGVRGSRA